MKLNSYIARYIRRCGYAAALTLAASTILPAAGETVIEYLTHDGVTTEHITRASEYEFKLDLSKPDTTGITPWGTGEGSRSIISQVLSGDGAIKGWCPWRTKAGGSPGHDYEIFVPEIKPGGHYTTSQETSGGTTWIANAIRPTIQNALPGVDNYNKNVEEISYIGARSLTPSQEESDSHAFCYYAEEDVLSAPIFNQDGIRQTRVNFRPVYGADGEQLCDELGRKLVTARTTTQYYKQVVDEATGDISYEALPSHTGEIRSAYVGDTTLGQGRGEIAASETPVNLSNNKLIINHSGFSLAVGAYSQYGDVSDNLTYIHDVRVSDDIIGASSYNGKAWNNNTIVARAQAIGQNTTLADEAAGVNSSNYNNSGKVMGVWSSSKVQNDAWNNKLFIYGSTIYQDASATWTGGSVWDNQLLITRCEIATGLQDVDAVMGGYSTRTGKAVNNMLIVDDTFDAIAAGLPEEDISASEGAAGGKTGSVPDVTTVHEDMYGGRTSRGYGDNGAHGNKVIVRGITTPGTQADNQGRMVTTTVEGNIFGGVASNNSHSGEGVDFSAPAASATGNIVSVNNADVKSVVTVPILQGRQPEIWGKRKLSIGVGKIIGGYVGAPRDGRTPGNANENTVYIANSSVENSVYGGVNLGAGEASKNQLHLLNTDTKGANLSFFGGWIESYADGGKTNDNHVILYNPGWSMENTFLHGGWGNEVQTDADGNLLGADGTPLVKGATAFNGTDFLDKDGKTLASLKTGNLLKADGNAVFSTTKSFDGTHFFDEDLNQIGAIEKIAIKNTGSKDLMRGVERVSINKDADGKVTTVDFLSDLSDSPIATYYSETGKITGAAGVDITTGITSFDEATGIFADKDGKALVTIVENAIVNRADEIRLSGIASSSFNEETGELSFHDADGNLLATYTQSKVEGTDSEGNAVDIALPNEGNATTLASGNAGTLFSGIDGFNEYNTYTKGNWLHLAGWQGKLKGFDHFERLHFVITEEIDRTKPIITITGPVKDTGLTIVTEEGGTPSPIQVTADISEIADELRPGDVIPLFGHEDNEEIAGTKDIDKDSVVEDTQKYRRGLRNITLETEFKQWEGGEFDNFGVIEVVDRKDEAVPESRALIEGRIAMLTLNNLAGNLVAEQAVDSAARAIAGAAPAASNHYIPVAQVGKDGKGGVCDTLYAPKDELNPGRRLFFVMNGTHNKVDSGSDVDVDGVNALVGISEGFLENNALTLAGFMETGWGQYTTRSHFGYGPVIPRVRGTGETSYVGAGVLMRYRLSNLSRSMDGFSVDASVRAGRQEMDYTTHDFRDENGCAASYTHESPYISAHVGINYTTPIADKLVNTAYLRYLWTHIGDDDATICGDLVTFEAMQSHRVRLGDRVVWQLNENWQPYAGAAFEWDFSGTSRAHTHGAGITAPSMRGGSVIAEVGTVWQPSLTTPLWLEFAAQATVGKHEGYSGKIGVSIGF